MEQSTNATSGGQRNGLSGTADLMPPIYRQGSMDHLKCGSLRDGVVVPYRAPQSQCVGNTKVSTEWRGA